MQATTTKLEPSQVDKAIEVLGHAFRQDPIFNYLLPDNSTNALLWLLRVALRYSHSYDHTYTTTTNTGELQGIASWIPPSGSGSSVTRILQAGALILPFKLGILRFAHTLSWSWAMEELHKRNMWSKPHWYLSLLGVSLNSQGYGIGSLLIEPILRQAYSDGLPIYLETSTELAVRFYQKHGFKVVWGGELLKGSPYLWAMEREA
ncbi:hypothetical protein NIES2101_30115 [Calothrix sp. HK-06]|nr:hypothetical protein NIES2101_30115 [Calothrix sp. HK-06]